MIHVNESLVDYILEIVHATRNHPEIALGVSTRGVLTFHRAVQAFAMVRLRDYATPDDVKKLAVPVLSHRIVLRDRALRHGDFTPEARLIDRIVSETPVPR